ncbi:acyltransferase family protein [Rhizobium sp. P38BS-XIX]|uniref:acyltransferase family protein n=1 Tax=Rhizobium sp. P38BS-XIX TaxID=2726740 RepID=UPI00145679E6|nr:acyltransferase family protein [Rhizobium sp. P38BS-XIX]
MQRDEVADILRGLGIIAVVAGHAGTDIGIKVLPVYSYHMPLFFFVSGLFYRDDRIFPILPTFSRLASRLLLPALFALVAYDFVILRVLHRFGLPFGGASITPKFLEGTFLFGGEFSAAYWFVGTYLFIYLYFHIIHVRLHHCMIGLISGATTTRLFWGALYLTAAAISVYLSVRLYGDVQEENRHFVVAQNWHYIAALRFVFGAGFYYLGSLFARYKDDIPRKALIPIFIAGVAFVVEAFIFNNFSVFFSMQIMSFPNVYTPIATSLIGIIIFYAISTALAGGIAGKILSSIGRHSNAIFLNHIFGFFLFNLLLVFAGVVNLVDITSPYYRFREYDTYSIYIIFGVGFSLAIPLILNGLTGKFKRSSTSSAYSHKVETR